MKLNLSKRTPFVTAFFISLALVVGAASVHLVKGPQPAAAETTSSTEITLTKWVLGEGPMMNGIVGGDFGAGSMTGEIVTMDPTVAKDRVTEIEALYQIKGANHSFEAHIHARLYNKTGTGTIDGIVTDGWLAGTRIEGEFKAVKCDQSKAGCFQVALHLMTDSLSH